MSIFANNVIPTPTNKNWNNVGYELWMDVLNEKDYRRHGPDNLWFSNPEDAAAYRAFYKKPWQSKNQLKNSFKNRTRLGKIDIEVLDEVVQQGYSKYGVWLKYKVQFDKNGRIKSIVFTKFC